MQGDPSMFPMCLRPATVRFPHWDGSPRCKHRGVVCKAIRAYSPMSLGPDVCCTGPLTRKDLSPDRAKLATVVNREKPLLFVKTPQKVKVVKPRTNVLTERSH